MYWEKNISFKQIISVALNHSCCKRWNSFPGEIRIHEQSTSAKTEMSKHIPWILYQVTSLIAKDIERRTKINKIYHLPEKSKKETILNIFIFFKKRPDIFSPLLTIIKKENVVFHISNVVIFFIFISDVFHINNPLLHYRYL